MDDRPHRPANLPEEVEKPSEEVEKRSDPAARPSEAPWKLSEGRNRTLGMNIAGPVRRSGWLEAELGGLQPNLVGLELDFPGVAPKLGGASLWPGRLSRLRSSAGSTEGAGTKSLLRPELQKRRLGRAEAAHCAFDARGQEEPSWAT